MAPQRKDYENILGEDVDWQIADAVREEFDDDEVELRLAKECEGQVNGWESDLQDMEEILAATEGCDERASDRGRRESEGEANIKLQGTVRMHAAVEGCAGLRRDHGERTTDERRRTDVTMIAARENMSTATIHKPTSQSIQN